MQALQVPERQERRDLVVLDGGGRGEADEGAVRVEEGAGGAHGGFWGEGGDAGFGCYCAGGWGVGGERGG